MIITFNELRRIKDKLPSGSSQRIADELGIDVETVRNYFGGKHDAKEGGRRSFRAGSRRGCGYVGRYGHSRCGHAYFERGQITPFYFRLRPERRTAPVFRVARPRLRPRNENAENSNVGLPF